MISAPTSLKKSALPDLLEIALFPCLVILAPPAAATNEERQNLANVRNGEYEIFDGEMTEDDFLEDMDDFLID